MWTYVLLGCSFVLTCGLPIVGYLTKSLALRHMRQTVEHYNDLAATYTDTGTPEELQDMLEELHEYMEELNELDYKRPCTAAARVRSRK
eukprot:COSAG05_NODE_1844_length_3977_cov_2.730015_5_plen_89_part_00